MYQAVNCSVEPITLSLVCQGPVSRVSELVLYALFDVRLYLVGMDVVCLVFLTSTTYRVNRRSSIGSILSQKCYVDGLRRTITREALVNTVYCIA